MSKKKDKNPWGLPDSGLKQQPQKVNKKSEDKFNEASKRNIEAAKKNLHNYESSSEEEDISSNNILDSVFKNYSGDNEDLQKTQEFLENSFLSGTAICLICIGSVKRLDAIWSCNSCYSFFHLQCLQRWANDSMAQKYIQQELDQGHYNNLGEFIPAKIQKIINWDCPKCRTKYLPSEIPRHYECYCHKEINPEYHPWLVPHSCGEQCNKSLKPDCGHKCLLLCHPGPCPPCPQIISKSCKCERSSHKTIRCSKKNWTCSQKCTLKLSCGIHTCGLICHGKNECQPCTKRSIQSCICGNKSKERNCSELIWKCEKVCNKSYSCNLHKCEERCHSGSCGQCLLGEPRSCPCGKQMSVAPCSEQIDPCGDTCLKLLSCNIHQCVERCHKGDCSQCLEIIVKKCRCGLHTKELPCYKDFLCETKCKDLRSCKKHPCSRKCCDSKCPPCDKICNKNLSCGKHKCKSLCHDGQCYPCSMKSSVKCRCQATSVTVPCGREKKTKPPKCMQPCKIPSKCHHTNPHRCHSNECPTCNQICDLRNDTTKCDHPCQANCHDSVKIVEVDKNFKPAGPWEVARETYTVKKLPHPKCEIPVSVVCIGGHETALWPCHNSLPTSCQRFCERKLNCGNHSCKEICHSVKDQKSITQDDNCLSCNEGCILPRPTGCVHPCKRPCHPPPCNPCNANIKTHCHCGLTQVFYKCDDFFKDLEDLDDREKILCCGGRCIKNYPCGHRCVAKCHSGICPNPEICRKKIKTTCECKFRKIEISCEKLRSQNYKISCDESCEKNKKEMKLAGEKLREAQKILDDEKNRLELEMFENKFGKKTYKEKKVALVEEKKDSSGKIIWIAGSMVLVLTAIFIFIIVNE